MIGLDLIPRGHIQSVTTNAPYAPAKACWILIGWSKSPLTTSTPFAASSRNLWAQSWGETAISIVTFRLYGLWIPCQSTNAEFAILEEIPDSTSSLRACCSCDKNNRFWHCALLGRRFRWRLNCCGSCFRVTFLYVDSHWLRIDFEVIQIDSMPSF